VRPARSSTQPGLQPSRETVDLSIVIVNWNVCDLLRRCLHSILDPATPDESNPGIWHLRCADLRICTFETLVVDSASSDNSVAMLCQEFPAVRLYASETNLGYSGGNNLGMLESRGRHVLLLNPDTEVLGDAVSTMVGACSLRDGAFPRCALPLSKAPSCKSGSPGTPSCSATRSSIDRTTPRVRRTG